MFRVDQPILSCSEDDLGRQPFAEALAEAILKHDSEDSIVLGLFGPWGSGKTSILNCVREYIENTSKSLPEKKRPVFTIFNPWTYSDQNQLIAQFFRQVSAEIKGSTFIKKAKKIGKILEQFLLIFRPVAQVAQIAVPGVGLVASTVVEGAAAAAKVIAASKQLESEDPEHLKEELDKLLGKLQNKIIVVIDDIDRLNHVEIRQIFQLVKKLADFKNTVYLLAFDKNVVLKALGKVQEGIGEQYLEKVITVAFDIPNPGKSEIEAVLTTDLERILGEKWSRKHWDFLYGDKLKYFFRNLRDAKRYINAFRFSFGLLKDDINPDDLMFITAVQVRFPRLYDAIRDDKSLFLGQLYGLRSGILEDEERTKSERQELGAALQEIFQLATELSPDLLKQLMIDMFPEVEWIYGQPGAGPHRLREWRQQKRICSPDFFDRYFRLSVPSWQLSQAEIDGILSHTTSPREFRDQLSELEKQNRFQSFISFLHDVDPKNMPENQIATIVTTLIYLDHVLGGSRVSFAVASVIKGLASMDGRLQLLCDAIRSCELSLYTMIWVVTDQNEAHKEYGDVSQMRAELKPQYLIVDEQGLIKLNNAASDKISQWAEDGRLVNHPKLPDILEQWKMWAHHEVFERCSAMMLEKDDALIEVIASFFDVTSGDKMSSAQEKSCVNRLREVIDISSLEARIKKIRDSKAFVSLHPLKQFAIQAVIEGVWPERSVESS
jgi:predicted KAP-like P-loop ATPase